MKRNNVRENIKHLPKGRAQTESKFPCEALPDKCMYINYIKLVKNKPIYKDVTTIYRSIYLFNLRSGPTF